MIGKHTSLAQVSADNYAVPHLASGDLPRDVGLLQSIQLSRCLTVFATNTWSSFLVKWKHHLKRYDPSAKVCSIGVPTTELSQDTRHYHDIDSVDLDPCMTNKACSTIFVHTASKIFCATLSSAFFSQVH